jgi:ubiquitin-protein ligase E3 C
LELTFAINSSEFGEIQTIELKPNGKNITVTNDNKIEYIHLLADFKLNKQIHDQVMAFRNGMCDILDLDLLRLFNFNELQSLISGADKAIDVDDWRAYTVYAGNKSLNFFKINKKLIKT